MRRMIGILLISLLVVSGTSIVAEGPARAREPYLLLAAASTSTFQRELDDAVDAGYQVRLVSPTSGQELLALLEWTPDAPKSYKLLATTRTRTMEKELNEFGRIGYRLVRGSAAAKALGASPFLPTKREEELVVLMESDPRAHERYEYRLLATTLTGTLAREIDAAQAAGFELADLVSRGEHIVVMERPAKRATIGP